MGSTLQSVEIMAVVAFFVELFKTPIKAYAPEPLKLPLIVLLAMGMGAAANILLYGYTQDLLLEGLLLGLLASGAYKLADNKYKMLIKAIRK